MKTKRYLLVAGAAVAVSLGAGTFLAGANDRAAGNGKLEQAEIRGASRSVRVEKVNTVLVDETRRFPGVVRGSREASLSFRVGGPLVEVPVEPGVPVKKGDLLMQIDPRDFLDRIRSLEAELAGAEAVYRKAQRDHARIAKLYEQKVAADSDFDAAISSREFADAEVKRLAAQLQIVRHSLLDTELRAPFDGVVTRQNAENREMVQPGQVVLQFRNIQVLEVEISLAENDMVGRLLDVGAQGEVSFPAVEGQAYSARLKEWRAEADPLTRTYAVTFELNAPDGLNILPGMSAEVTWDDGLAQREAIAVPVSALCEDDVGSSFVWVYDVSSGRAERRPVQVGGLTNGSRVVVTAGLELGEQFVVSGSRFIHEGQSLAIIVAN